MPIGWKRHAEPLRALDCGGSGVCESDRAWKGARYLILGDKFCQTPSSKGIFYTFFEIFKGLLV